VLRGKVITRRDRDQCHPDDRPAHHDDHEANRPGNASTDNSRAYNDRTDNAGPDHVAASHIAANCASDDYPTRHRGVGFSVYSGRRKGRNVLRSESADAGERTAS
jgi:hypothetical protein